ncbi:MAG: uracil-DNA glycosylase family protein [Luteimonas sp.]
MRACTLCAAHLPHGPRPIVQASAGARLLIVGQAPGARVHASGVPWSDASGRRLRNWLQLDEATFFDARRVAIVPMGFCYPGKASSGDAPPRPECRQAWHPRLLPLLPDVRLTLLVGHHAQAYFLGGGRKTTSGDTVRAWREYCRTTCPCRIPVRATSRGSCAIRGSNPTCCRRFARACATAWSTA